MSTESTSLKKVSHHIMPTSANLLGFSFIVLTSIKSLGLSHSGLTDKLTAVCIVLFSLSTLMSFMSLRAQDGGRATYQFEKVAQVLFLSAVVLCTVLALLLVFDVVKLGQ